MYGAVLPRRLCYCLVTRHWKRQARHLPAFSGPLRFWLRAKAMCSRFWTRALPVLNSKYLSGCILAKSGFCSPSAMTHYPKDYKPHGFAHACLVKMPLWCQKTGLLNTCRWLRLDLRWLWLLRICAGLRISRWCTASRSAVSSCSSSAYHVLSNIVPYSFLLGFKPNHQATF